jgi:exosortase
VPNRRDLIIWGAFALATTGWAYWGTLTEVAERWRDDPQYSHGWLVPLFSACLLVHRRNLIPTNDRFQPLRWSGGWVWWLWWLLKSGVDTARRISVSNFRTRWWGLGVVALAVVARGAAVAFYQPWLDAGSLLICLAGLAVTLGGWPALRWAWPAVLFLGFMIPLPFRLQYALGGQLQAVATTASTYLLQAVGVPAIAEGNVILLTDARVGVVEACNGLSMLVTFFALAVGFALVLGRHWVYGAVLVAAAAPIAVGANVVRITVTGLLYEAERHELARQVFHDVAGWLMMPLGVAMLAAVLGFLDRAYRPPPARPVTA